MTDATYESISVSLSNLLFAATLSPAVNGSGVWRTTSRRLKLWGDVPPESQPACYMVEHADPYEYSGRGTMQRRFRKFSVFCYARTDDPSDIGDQYINSMLTGIETVLAPDDVPAGVLTLGGQVNWCRIEGQVFRDPGDIDNQALLVIPVNVLWP